MSGADIPYQLRPNKFIDRQLFIELLSRLVIPRGPERYIYASMGGRHLVDHYAVYSRLGIKAQFSFDFDKNEVARARFNRPTGLTLCEEMSSAALPAEIDNIAARFPKKSNFIIWLDYTSSDRRAQFQEAVQTLARLNHGDIFRITLNASLQSLGAGDEWKKEGASGPAEYRAEKLRLQIREYLPSDVHEIGETELHVVLSRSLENAAQAAQALNERIQVKPVLITSYKDGARMLTVTCAVVGRDAEDPFPSPLFRRWPFACSGWDKVFDVSVPVLSPKEQYRLDATMHRGPKRMLASLGFMPSATEASSIDALKSYRSFHRYYPSFRHVED